MHLEAFHHITLKPKEMLQYDGTPASVLSEGNPPTPGFVIPGIHATQSIISTT